MEFWIIMIVFIAMGGTCSLTGTWWDRKKEKLESRLNRGKISGSGDER